MLSNNTKAFFELVKAGLWEKDIRLSQFGTIDYNEILRLSEEQSVVGIVAAGLEHVVDVKLPKEDVLQFVGQALQVEQQNQAMNVFISKLVEKMRAGGIYTFLLKGQGIAQCYEKPLWRSCGDVDLFLSEDNYNRAKELLAPIATVVEMEYEREKHLGMIIDGWEVELHGHLYSGLSSRVERVLDRLQEDTFYGGQVRSWMNGQTQIFLLKAENDAFYVFTHILQHFYKEGVGLRQICDWCRLLYTYRDSLNYGLLEQRIKRARLVSEWKAFGALAIEYLGFPKDSMPLLNVDIDLNANLKRKADRIMEFILKSGNMGHNRGSWLMEHNSWLSRQYVVRKAFSMFRRIGDLINHARIFPLDALRFFPRLMFNGVMSAIKGE